MMLSGKRISVVKAMGRVSMFVKVVEIGSVLWGLPRMGSILGSGGSIPGFVKACWYRIHSGAWMNASGLFWSDINRNCLEWSRHWGRAIKRQIFFCVWRGRWIFCESPPGVGLEVLLKRIFWNRGWEIIKYVRKILTTSYVPENSRTRF